MPDVQKNKDNEYLHLIKLIKDLITNQEYLNQII